MRARIEWSLEDWFDINKKFEIREKPSKLFEVGFSDINIKIIPKDSNVNPIYTKWQRMLERSFCPKYKAKFPTYESVSVCERWLKFSNFREDYLTMIGNLKQRRNFILDKDLLIKGNKIYSPNTCCLIPANINSFLTKANVRRGCLPVGVTKRHNGNKFMVTLSYNGVNRNLGDYGTSEEAFLVYKKHKEDLAKLLAVENRHLLLEKEYNALYNYEVDFYN